MKPPGRMLWWFLGLLSALRAGPEVRTEMAVEAIRSSDVELARAALSSRLARGYTEFTVTAARSTIGIDYRPAPFDFRGAAVVRREANTALRIAGQHRPGGGALTGLFGLGGYRGYTSYRSVWLDEYYRQQYANLGRGPGLETYRTADPAGREVSFGTRWEYIKGNAFAQLGAAYARDRIAPGYEIDFAGLRRGADTLGTASVSLAFENVLSRRVRSRVEVRAADTSGRETRFGGEAEVRAALGEQWIARFHAGGARERPAFVSRFGGLAVERALGAGLSGFVEGRLYRDSGEIENALLFSSASPALRSRAWGAGLRRDGERWSWRLSANRLRTDHAATNPNTDFFRHLYRDRTWLTWQAAVSAQF